MQLYEFLRNHIAENYKGASKEQVEAAAREIEYYLKENVIPTALNDNDHLNPKWKHLNIRRMTNQ